VPWDGKTFGEVWIRSTGLTLAIMEILKELKNHGQKSWFKTGDIAVVDEQGYVLVIDRLKDVVKSGGEWIPTVVLEDLLSSHPSVSTAAVIGVRSEKWSERPIALVILKQGYEGKATEEDLKMHLMKYVENGKIPKWWIPDKIFFVKEIPLTSVGKIDKKVIREKYKDYTSLINF